MSNFLKNYSFIAKNLKRILSIWNKEDKQTKDEFTDEFIVLLAHRASIQKPSTLKKVKHYDQSILENSSEIYFKMKFDPKEFLSTTSL